MKKIAIFTVILGAIFLICASYSQSKTASYYSGDALNYNNNLYIVTANTGNLELFRLNGRNLDRLAKIQPFDQRFGRYGNFYDAHLRQEGSRLFVYAVTDFSVYKYEIVNGQNLSLITSLQNSYWEWYNRVDEIGDHLVTISAKSVKIWSDDLQVINEYAFSNSEVPYNVRGNQTYLMNIQNGNLYAYNRENRQVVAAIPLNFRIERSAHKAFLDENNDIYVADDYYAKKYNLDGKLLGSFKHLDYESYDIAASGFSQSVYFSNGIGVVRLDKDSMKATSWAFTNTVAGPRGWAMGLDVVNLDGDKVIVFNNSNILVLDANLKKIASFLAEDENGNASVTENLFLNLDKNQAAANSPIALSGGGYVPNEDLSIDFAGTKQSAKADARGRFQRILTVPNTKAGVYDIKVSGLSSKLSYSISFRIE